jgi:hypothetical protein
MRKSIGAFVASIMLVLASNSAHAALTWTGYTNITSIEVIGDGGFLVTVASGLPSSCSAANAIYVQAAANGPSAEGVRALLGAAMTSLTLRRTVRILYDNATQYCYGQYLTIQ